MHQPNGISSNASRNGSSPPPDRPEWAASVSVWVPRDNLPSLPGWLEYVTLCVVFRLGFCLVSDGMDGDLARPLEWLSSRAVTSANAALVTSTIFYVVFHAGLAWWRRRTRTRT